MTEAEKYDSKGPKMLDVNTLIMVIEDGLYPGGKRKKIIGETIREELYPENLHLATYIESQMKKVSPPYPREVELVGETAYVVYNVMEYIRAEERGEIGREVDQRVDLEKSPKVDIRAQIAVAEDYVAESLGKSRGEIDKMIKSEVYHEIPPLADYMQLQLGKAASLETIRLVAETALVVYGAEQLLRQKKKEK